MMFHLESLLEIHTAKPVQPGSEYCRQLSLCSNVGCVHKNAARLCWIAVCASATSPDDKERKPSIHATKQNNPKATFCKT
jgi:hypothetical protein